MYGREEGFTTPTQNLDILRHRVGATGDLFTKGVIPVETSRGLVAVRSDHLLSSVLGAEVVVVEDDLVTASSYTVRYDHDGSEPVGPGTEASCIVGDHEFEVGGLGYDWTADPSAWNDPARQEQRQVADILRRVTGCGRAYDPLHTFGEPRRYPENDNRALYPFAGEEYGSQVVLMRMLAAGVQFPPALIEASLEAFDR